MAPFVEVIGTIMKACGSRAIVLPEPDERSLFYSNQLTSGTECLPYRVTLGDFLKFFYQNPDRTNDVELA
ncbi:MAG: hypothetical protein NT134_02715, partial [Chloroflexi bacterium]|nr:hypothetical protein [Chloroflexota bacterium]